MSTEINKLLSLIYELNDKMKVSVCGSCDDTLKAIHQVLRLLCYVRSDKIFEEATNKIQFWEQLSKLRNEILKKKHLLHKDRDKKTFKEESSQTDLEKGIRINPSNALGRVKIFTSENNTKNDQAKTDKKTMKDQSSQTDDSDPSDVLGRVKIEILDPENNTKNVQSGKKRMKEQSSQTDIYPESRVTSRNNSDASDVSGQPGSNLIGIEILDSDNEDEFTIYKEAWFLEAELALLGDGEPTAESPQENTTKSNAMETDSKKVTANEMTNDTSKVEIKTEIKEEKVEETIDLIESSSNDSSNGQPLEAPSVNPNTSEQESTTIQNQNPPENNSLLDILNRPQRQVTEPTPAINEQIEIDPKESADHQRKYHKLVESCMKIVKFYLEVIKPTWPIENTVQIYNDVLKMRAGIATLSPKFVLRDPKKFREDRNGINLTIQRLEKKMRVYEQYFDNYAKLNTNTNTNQIPYQISVGGINIMNNSSQDTLIASLNTSLPQTVLPVTSMQFVNSNLAPNNTGISQNPIFNAQTVNPPPYPVYITSHDQMLANIHQGVHNNAYFSTHQTHNQNPKPLTPQVNKSPTASAGAYNQTTRSPHNLNIITPPPTPNTNQQITYSNQIQSPTNQFIKAPISSIMKSPGNSSMQSGINPSTQNQQQFNSVPYPRSNHQNPQNDSYQQPRYSQTQTNFPHLQNSSNQQQTYLSQYQMNELNQLQNFSQNQLQTIFSQNQQNFPQQSNFQQIQTNNPQSHFNFPQLQSQLQMTSILNHQNSPQHSINLQRLLQTNIPPHKSNIPPQQSNIPYTRSNPPPQQTNIPHSQPKRPPHQSNMPQAQPNHPSRQSNISHPQPNLPSPQSNIPHSQPNLPSHQSNIPHPQSNLPSYQSNFPQSQPNHQSNIPQSHPNLPQPTLQQYQKNGQPYQYTFESFLKSQEQKQMISTLHRQNPQPPPCRKDGANQKPPWLEPQPPTNRNDSANQPPPYSSQQNKGKAKRASTSKSPGNNNDLSGPENKKAKR